jgi:hypothetical protein
MRTIPTRDIDEPHRPKFLIDNELPKEPKSKMEIEEPTRLIPRIEIDDPIRHKLRSASELPKVEKSTTEMLAPK